MSNITYNQWRSWKHARNLDIKEGLYDPFEEPSEEDKELHEYEITHGLEEDESPYVDSSNCIIDNNFKVKHE